MSTRSHRRVAPRSGGSHVRVERTPHTTWRLPRTRVRQLAASDRRLPFCCLSAGVARGCETGADRDARQPSLHERRSRTGLQALKERFGTYLATGSSPRGLVDGRRCCGSVGGARRLVVRRLVLDEGAYELLQRFGKPRPRRASAGKDRCDPGVKPPQSTEHAEACSHSFENEARRASEG